MTPSFGAPWSAVAGVVAITAAMYATLLVSVRVAGRRTLAQVSAFDVLITIALGTMLGSTALSPSVSYVEGFAGTATLLTLQVALGVARRSSRRLRKLVDFAPLVVVDRGQMSLPKSPLGPQITADELCSQLRHGGAYEPGEVERAILEPMGGVSVAKIDIARREHGGPDVRSTREVLESHLRHRQAGDLEGDLRENYAPDVVQLSRGGVHRGHEGVRALAGILRTYTADVSSATGTLLVESEIGLLLAPSSGEARDPDRADTYIVRNGRIVAQAVHHVAPRGP